MFWPLTGRARWWAAAKPDQLHPEHRLSCGKPLPYEARQASALMACADPLVAGVQLQDLSNYVKNTVYPAVSARGYH